MKNIIKTFVFQLGIIILNLFLSVQCQIDEETSMRALSCVSVINHKNKEGNGPEATIYSPQMLTCFIKIKDAQTDKILSNLESGAIPLEDEEIDELTNIESLKEFSNEYLNKKSKELEKAIEEFKKFDEDFTKLKERKENENSDGNDNLNQAINTNSDSKKYTEWLDDNKNLFIGVSICIVVFILILLFGKSYDENIKKEENKETNNKNENNKKVYNKNKIIDKTKNE